MNYSIQYQDPQNRFIYIKLQLQNINEAEVHLQLAAWRPGRYEMQNYARNIRGLAVYDILGNPLPFKKESRERWKISTLGNAEMVVEYQCYARQMDAGGCWIDEDQLYINFIYCLLYNPATMNEPCSVLLELPEKFKIACGLPSKDHQIFANNFFELSDSPMIASPDLQCFQYEAGGITFNIWMQGKFLLDHRNLIEDFKKFSAYQIEMMGGFPEKDYHFLFQFLPYRHYHGVEHRNSTVIVLGPSEETATPAMYHDLIGISSHELFHAWNICKIRPVEMMPYNFARENYFRTGFVVEGFTTYFGDLFLLKSGVISLESYLNDINGILQKHFDTIGNNYLSLAESSFDLWVDGYTPGIPDRKVSIYVKGAIAALILDLELRHRSNQQHTLDDMMRWLWKDFGAAGRGYAMEDIEYMTTFLAGTSCKDYFDECIYGLGDMKPRLQALLQTVACKLEESPAITPSQRDLGIKIILLPNNLLQISQIYPESPAEKYLSVGDVLISVNGKPVMQSFEIEEVQNQFEIVVLRDAKQLTFVLKKDGRSYFPRYKIVVDHHAPEINKDNFRQWLGVDFPGTTNI